MGAAAYEAVIAFVELIVIVVEVAHGDETLALVLDNLSVESPFGDTADNGFLGDAHAVGHVLHLLVLDAGTLG